MKKLKAKLTVIWMILTHYNFIVITVPKTNLTGDVAVKAFSHAQMHVKENIKDNIQEIMEGLCK